VTFPDFHRSVGRYLRELSGQRPGAQYHSAGGIINNIEEDVLKNLGRPALLQLRIEVLKALMSDSLARFRYPVTEEVQTLFEYTVERIRRRCEHSDDMHYVEYPDQYWKDLALCRRVMFPAGARIVQVDMGIPRNFLLRGSAAQRCRFLGVLLSMKKNKPVFQLHVHPDDLGEFDEEGWRRTLGRLARMLVVNRKSRGIYGSSWLYDPALGNVSPKLEYISSLSRKAGGQFFHVGKDSSGDALVRSPTRRHLAAAGAYVPQSYAVIWPRNVIIEKCRSW